MPRFPINRRIEGLPRTRIVLGPCPGCDLWTVEYDIGEVFAAWEPHEFSMVVEQILRDHAGDCSGLQEIIKALMIDAAPAPGRMGFENR